MELRAREETNRSRGRLPGKRAGARSLLLECQFLSLRVEDAELPVLGARSRSPGHHDVAGSHTGYGTWVRLVQLRCSVHNSTGQSK